MNRPTDITDVTERKTDTYITPIDKRTDRYTNTDTYKFINRHSDKNRHTVTQIYIQTHRRIYKHIHGHSDTLTET